MSLAKTICDKKKEFVEDCKAQKAAMKQAAKTRTVKPLPEAVDRLARC